MIKMDIHNIEYKKKSFDVVFCNHVMEHVENDLKAMKEIYRVLKPNGWAGTIIKPLILCLLKVDRDILPFIPTTPSRY